MTSRRFAPSILTAGSTAMIATVTLNPAFDRTIYVRGFRVGDTNRIERTEADAGGKGINAARMLAELGAETVALGFIGGRTGRFIEHVLAEEGIPTDFLHTKAETRTNVDVQDLAGGPPTGLNDRGGPITPHELDALRARVRFWAAKSKTVIVGGSVPQGAEPGIYRELIEIVQIEDARAVLDADDEPLSLGLTAHPMMIKPNVDEAGRLCGRELRTVEDVATAARDLLQRGIEIVVVSMGERGAVAVRGNEVWHAVPPKVEAVSTVGSGDSMVAGISLGLAQGRSLPESLALGSAAGAATAMTSGAEMGKRKDVDRLLPRVVLNRLR